MGRDEGNGVDMAEAGSNQGAQVIRLNLGRDGFGQTLPGIPGTLDDLDGRGHGDRASAPTQREVGAKQQAVGYQG